MNPDNFKETWQTQTSQTRLTIDADLLLKEVQRNQRLFTATIFWRDVREVGIALLLVPVWIYLGTRSSQPWTWYLTVPALLWIAGFMLVDRVDHKRRPPELGEALRQRIEGSLAQVEHQIWLLRNVFWWYLLPLILSILAYLSQVAWQERSGGWLIAVAMTLVVSLVVIVMTAVYWVNRKAVRSYLEPRRQELEVQLLSLSDETPAASS
jgi:hypothetical protein